MFPLKPLKELPKTTIAGIIVALALATTTGMIGYQLGYKANIQKSLPQKNTARQQPPTPTLLPETEATISYTFSERELLLRYKSTTQESVFIESPQAEPVGEPQKVQISINPEKWIDILTLTSTAGESWPTWPPRIFDFRSFSNKQGFVFTLTGSGEQQFTTYYFRKDIDKTPMILIPTREKPVPRILAISPSGKYVAIENFSCWSCGGGILDAAIYNLQTLDIKELGDISDFRWKNEVQYEYKQEVRLPCKEAYNPTDPCFKDPDTLPWIEGTI